MLLFQRKQVLHGIRFAFCLQHSYGGLTLGLFHFLRFGGFGFEFGDADLLLLNLSLHAHLIVLLFFQKQGFESLGVFGGQLNVAQHDFFDNDAVCAKFASDGIGGALADFFSFGCEDFSHGVVGNKLSPSAGHDRRHDFLFDGLRQVALNVIETRGIKTVADSDGESEVESFFRLHTQRVVMDRGFGFAERPAFSSSLPANRW